MADNLVEAVNWVSGAEPRIQAKGEELLQARQTLKQMQEEAIQLFDQVEQVQQAISALESQIAAMQAQLNNTSDDDDNGNAAALRSQIGALQGQLGQYRAYRSQLLSRLQQLRSEISAKSQEISVTESKLQHADGELDKVANIVTQQYRDSIKAKESLSKVSSDHFSVDKASEQINNMQRRINTCMDLFNRISNMKQYIQQLLSSGDERDEREKKLTRGPSR